MGSRRILAGGAAVLLLVAVVALATRAHTPAGGTAHGLDRDILLEYTLLIFGVLSLAVVPTGIYLFVMGRGAEKDVLPARRNWMAGVLVSLIVFGVIAAVLMASRASRSHHGHGGNPVNPLAGLAKRTKRVPEAVRFDWAPVIVVASLTVLALIAGGILLLRHRRAQRRPERIAAEFAVALDRTIADLRDEADPRRAVIAAYAQMERALARAGLSRAPSEAPREYLERVLPEVGAGAESAERLTALFEPAKFSPHTIDAAMKDAAISALESLRDDLRSQG